MSHLITIKDYLTVYAVHSISNQSGISGEAGGAFACRNAAGNPATPQCTPVDSAVFNCTHGRDTFYNSYYQWRSSAGRVILEMSTANRTRARNHALAACSSANMVQVIANSAMRGGTGEMPTATQPLGVALTSIETAGIFGDWKEAIMHEFGHTFGGLWDEYWNGLTYSNNYPNVTNNSNASTVKWSQWVGYKNTGHFEICVNAGCQSTGSCSHSGSGWYRPHQSCIMRFTSSPFCPVCVHGLLGRMATATGLTLFNTTNTGTNNIRIDKLNISVSGTFDIPERINGRIVTEIGSSAFANQTQLSQISIPSSVTSIGDGAFKNCSNLTSVSPISNIQSIGAEAFYGCGSLSNISIPAGLTSIGQKAFAGCDSLNISVAASNPNYSSAGNIFYNKNKTVLYSAGKVASEVTIPSSVTEISPHAFEGNPHLFKIYFPNTIILGAYAFADCEALNSAYFSSYNTPSMGVNSFAGDEITVYVPYDAQNAYRTAFAGYPLTIDSVHSQVQFISNGTTLKTIDVPYGSTKNNIFTPEQNGYTFCGWFDNPALGGSPYQNGGKWEITENLNLYAKWEAKNYTVTLNANDGIYNGVTSYPVAFHTSFSIPSSPLPYKPPTKEGYTFDGWYDSLTGGTRYITVSGQSVNLWDKTADTALYARWAIESYEIKIDVDGNFVWLGATGLSNVPCSIPYGTLISGINLVPTFKATEQGYKEGRNFDHFEYENKQINWERVTDLGDNGKVVVIFPKWTLEKHTIYFDMQMTGSILPLQNVEWGSPITLPSIIRTGYNFTGWYTSGGIKIEWNSMPDLTPKTAQNTFLEAQTNGSIQLLARYSVIQYNIAYSLDGGVNASANPASYNITTVKTFLSPTKTGHNFMGWYTDSEKINPISGLNYTTGHKTLYAKWEKMKYSITYSNVVFDTVPSLNLKGIALVYIGSFNNQQLPPTVFEYGNTVFIGNVIATYYMNSYNTGYVEDTLIFDGWYKEANFQNRAYTIAENRNVTVYGKWRYEKKYTRAGERKYTDADKNSQPFDLIHSLKKEYLTALGISKITVSISMEIKEVNAGTQLIYLCSASQTLYPFEVTHGGNSINKNYSTYTFDKTVSLNDFSDDALYLKYSASGSLGDDWCNRNVSVTVKSA